MAASTVRVLLEGCGRLCSGGLTRRTVGGLSGVILTVLSRRTPEISSLQQCTSFHSSAARRGLEEFFDDPNNWGETSIKSGDAWTITQLRGKSSEDLHKLWYVLLKEKNMLLTLEQESKRQRVTMPGSNRLYKVTKSMENLDRVVTERETALRLLQTGQEKGRPGEWRKDCFGETTWHAFKEWPIPWHMNKRHMNAKFYALPYVDHYDRLKLEQKIRADARKRNAAKKKRLDMEKRFPHIAKKGTHVREPVSVQIKKFQQEFYKALKEVEKYDRSSKLTVEEAILVYPEIVRDVARIVTAMPPTQVSVERLFSALKIIKSDLRASMKEDLAEAILFLRTLH